MEYRKPKGTFDLLPYGSEPQYSIDVWKWVEEAIKESTSLFCCHEIRTPIIEFMDLFEKSTGQESDIISKEMYSFLDKSNRLLCLRPEGTPPIMRAIGESKTLEINSKHRLYYYGPMFRYERPQNGRYRQFHQFGVEFISYQNVYSSLELLLLANRFLNKIGIKYSLEINNIGSIDERNKYKKYMVEKLQTKTNLLSEDSRLRINTNPLRILDSKDLQDKEITSSLDPITMFLSNESLERFDKMKLLLKQMGIPFVNNDKLVRGLDYYNDLVFEFISPDFEKSIGGGGQYDNLSTIMGMQKCFSMGFAFGIERLISLCNYNLQKRSLCDVAIISLDQSILYKSFQLAEEIRDSGISVFVETEKVKLRNALESVSKQNPSWIIVIGEKEISSKKLTVKNSKEQISYEVEVENLVNFLKGKKCS